MAGPTITISPGNADEVVLGPGDIEAVDCVKIHTAVSDFRADVSYDPSLKDLRGSEVHIDDPAASYFFRGFLLRTNSREAAGTADTAIEGLGIEHDLERNASEHTVTNTLIHDAIADYWSDNTGFSATVTDQTADNTTTGTQAQEANTDAEFNTLVGSIPDTTPLQVTSDTITTRQTCFTEGRVVADRTDNSGAVDNLSDTNATYSESTQLDTDGDFVEYEFTLNYDIPANEFRFHAREKDDGANHPDIAYFLDDTRFGTSTAFGSSYGWTQKVTTAGQDALGRVNAGTHTIRIEATTGATNNNYILDTIAPLDNRFHSPPFDNDVSDSSTGEHLSSPETHPDAVQMEFAVAPTTWNVTSATASTTWDDTTGNQRIQLKLDPDGTYLPDDGTEDNTTSVTIDPSVAGTAIRGRARFGRYGSRTGDTPTTGFNGQSLQSWEITFDGNDIPVYTDVTLEGSDLAILQQMHEDARMRSTATHAAGSKTVESYPVGTTKATPDWDVIGKNFMADLGSEYANAITVRGARDSDGNRIKTTVTDSAAISEFGREHWEERRPDADSKVETDRIARQVLKTHLRESDVTAEREIASMEIAPGWAYNLTFQDGSTADVPSEEVHYRYRAGDVTGRVVFDVRATRLEERLNSVDSGLIRTQLSF